MTVLTLSRRKFGQVDIKKAIFQSGSYTKLKKTATQKIELKKGC